MSSYTDDMALQGNACGMIYGFVFDAPWGPEHKCPGCQPRPDDATNQRFWDRWHDIDKRYVSQGEKSACPILCGEVLPRPHTQDERAARGYSVAPMRTVEDANREINAPAYTCPSATVNYADGTSTQATEAVRWTSAYVRAHGMPIVGKAHAMNTFVEPRIEVPEDEPSEPRQTIAKRNTTEHKTTHSPPAATPTKSKRNAKKPTNQGSLF